jgi:uncharacterized protein (DUF1778 family)
MYGMGTKARLEMRVAPERAELIRRAAAARGESVTGFVLDAATRAAELELAVPHETLVPVEFFDQLLRGLDAVDDVPVELHRLAGRPRVFERG